MGMVGSGYANVPGMDTAYLTYETSFGWGPGPRAVYILPGRIDANAVDASQSPTWRLAPGLVLGVIASSGNYTQYDPTATDGSNIATAVLMEGLRMQDVFSGSNVAKALGVMVAGPIRAAGVHGLDQKARFDLRCQGFVFDDDPRGPLEWRIIEVAGNTTITIPTPAVGATYQNATEFVVTSGGGATTFNLPAIAPGLRYKFYNGIGQNLTVVGNTNIIGFNTNNATNIIFNTANNLLGASVEVHSVFVGSATYKWIVNDVSAGANTIGYT